MEFRFRPAKAAGLLFICMAIAFAGGCAQGGFGKNSNMNPRQFSNDGYLGTTNANPHIPGRYMSLTYDNDAKLMRQVLRDVDGVAGANITFNGANAYVTLKLKPGIDAKRVPTIERQAAAVLRFNFPRYDVFVKSVTERNR